MSVIDRARALAEAGEIDRALSLLGDAPDDDGAATASIRLRHEFFMTHDFDAPPPFPAIHAVTDSPAEIPEYTPDQLDAATYRQAMSQHGFMLVRGLVTEEQAALIRTAIDRTLAAFDDDPSMADDRARWFTPFRPLDEYGSLGVRRKFMRDAGSVWAVDSPKMFHDVLALFDRVGVRALVEEILGERPAMSANKFNLRRVPPGIPTNWHQDGSFLGEDTRSVNLWLSLSACGTDAPGLDIVPRRLEEVVPTGTDDAMFDWSVSQAVVDDVAGGPDRIVAPEFAPGDALLFDHLLLHRTSITDAMRFDRYAIESWFFSPSTFPEGQIPVLV